jgi:hypothetical protein
MGEDAIVEVNLGWGGRYRPDRWTPAVVRAQASQATPVILRWYVPRPGRQSMLIEQSVTLNPQSGDHLSYLPIGPDPAAVHLTVSDALTGRTLAHWPNGPISPISYADAQVREPIFIGVSGIGPALGTADSDRYAVSYLPPEYLPRRAIGYDGLDLLVLNRPQVVDLELEQQHAIAAWVRGGGRLLLWLDLQPLSADSPLLALLPGEGLAGFDARKMAGQPVAYTRLKGVPNDQLVTRSTVGLGEVTFLHVPPEAASASGIDYLPTGPRPEPVEVPILPQPALATLAPHDAAAAMLPLGLLGVAILIGPIDWLVLHRSERRMRRWWITLPGWLGMFALLIWYLPTQSSPSISVVIASQPLDRPSIIKGMAATTRGRLAAEEAGEISQMNAVGPIYWRTTASGLDRTSGPLEDLRFRQGGDGMFAASSRRAFTAEGTVFRE